MMAKLPCVTNVIVSNIFAGVCVRFFPCRVVRCSFFFIIALLLFSSSYLHDVAVGALRV